MLAYVFWHQPRPGTEAAQYEAMLAAFHESLAAVPPQGFRGSVAFRVSGAPWAPEGPVYEDWYLLRDAGALDPLNLAAVSGAHRRPHDTVAARAQWGAAGLYLLREGQPAFPASGRALWLAKPDGQSYDTFYTAIRSAAGAGHWALWGRQMVLGPTPEFCLHGVESAAVTGGKGIELILKRVWGARAPK